LGDYHSALGDYDTAIQMNPNLAVAYHNRAWVHAALENHEAAEKDAKKACELGECDALEVLKKQADK
jgi:tetratricopeptide (TPR) repeat protein